MIPDDEVPTSKPCPCGRGFAEILSDPTVEPNPKNGKETMISYHYKHEGCPIGGSVVLVDGEVSRMVGPLFNPRRFRSLIKIVDESTPAASSSTPGSSIPTKEQAAETSFLEAVPGGSE